MQQIYFYFNFFEYILFFLRKIFYILIYLFNLCYFAPKGRCGSVGGGWGCPSVKKQRVGGRVGPGEGVGVEILRSVTRWFLDLEAHSLTHHIIYHDFLE